MSEELNKKPEDEIIETDEALETVGDTEEYENDEEYEDEPEELEITVDITDQLLDVLVEELQNEAYGKARNTSLVIASIVFAVGVFFLLQHEWIPGVIIAAVAILMMREYLSSGAEGMRKRLAVNLGKKWIYTVNDKGIFNAATTRITWDKVARAKLKDGYYILSVQNSNVVFPQSSLSEHDRNTLEILLLEHVSDCKL